MPAHHPTNDPERESTHFCRTHHRLFPFPRTKSRRIMPACRQIRAIPCIVGLEKLLQMLRGRQSHLPFRRPRHSNRRPSRIEPASNSDAANTKRIRERRQSLRACSTKGRRRSLRYRYDFAAPFIVRFRFPSHNAVLHARHPWPYHKTFRLVLGARDAV